MGQLPSPKSFKFSYYDSRSKKEAPYSPAAVAEKSQEAEDPAAGSLSDETPPGSSYGYRSTITVHTSSTPQKFPPAVVVLPPAKPAEVAAESQAYETPGADETLGADHSDDDSPTEDEDIAENHSVKYQALISEHLTDKKSGDLPGIGRTLSSRLTENGYGKV